jgi:hypothetical protein
MYIYVQAQGRGAEGRINFSSLTEATELQGDYQVESAFSYTGEPARQASTGKGINTLAAAATPPLPITG